MKAFKKKYKRFVVLTLLIILIPIVFLYQKYIKYSWSIFVSNGQITSQILKYKKILIFGTNNSKVEFLDSSNLHNIAEVDMNTGGAVPLQFWKGNVLVTSDDKLSLINIKNRNKVWEFSSENQSFFKNTQIFSDYVLTGSTDGLIRKINIKDGKVVWKFEPKPLENLSSIVIEGGLNYFGNFIIVDNKVYFASQDKTLYVLDFESGVLVYKVDMEDTMTMGPEVYGKYLVVGTKSGKTMALNRNSGNLVWSNNDENLAICGRILASSDSDFPHFHLYTQIKQFFLRKIGKEKLTFYTFHSDGSLVARDLESGNLIWKSKNYGMSTTCPIFWRSTASFGTSSGNLTMLSLASGKVIFEKKDMGSILNPLYVSPKLSRVLPEWLNIFSPSIVVSNASGHIWSFDGFTGTEKWMYDAKAPTTGSFNVYGHDVLFVTSDGVVYRLNKNTGKVQINLHDRQFKVSREVQKVENTNVQEFTLQSDLRSINPWREADLTGVFIHESGKVVEMPGFYYDSNTWKVRFNPPLKGKWKWTMSWVPRGKTLIKSGEFVSETDTSNFYLRKFKDKSLKLTVDGKNIFNGLGLGDTMYDQNWNGTFLDDWATGNSVPLTLKNNSATSITYKSDKIVNFDDYIATYGPKGAGFNIFRWSLLNASQPLYTNLGYPTTYSVLQGKVGDSFVREVRDNNIHLWLTLFGFDVPFKESNDPSKKYLLKSYLRYMYARYGAYVDVWELANEVSIPKEMSKYLADEIRIMDNEKRMVSVSSTGYNFSESDIIAPHWYETEKINDSDLRAYQKIQEFKGYERPIVFAEQGNSNVNYDPTSAIRMRVRLWTAFFNSSTLMLWNQSDTKDFKAGIFPGNLYLGSEERGYTKILQDYTQNFPLDSFLVRYNLSQYGVRGYGLSANNLNAGYFYHFASPFTNTSFVVTIFTKSGGNIEWTNPSTGKVVRGGYCNPGNCKIVSPIFETDIAVKIIH